jgi:ketosteroid isomerase-like protein
MDLEHERRHLLERDAEWARLGSSGGDAERIVSFWSDDALVYPPGLPVVSGKATIRSYVQGALAIPGFHITWTTSEAILSADGRLAYLLSNNTIRQPDAQGDLVTEHGRAVTIWRREIDDDWRCVIDIWNNGQPLSPSSP